MTIEWKTFGEGWRRAAMSTPGFDCRVECKHEHKGDHGIGSERWWFIVSDGECALALDVASGRYPDTVTHVQNEPSHGYDLSLHVPWSAGNDAEEDIRLGRAGHECDLTEPGRCWIPYTTALGANEFWKLHGVDSFEQPESFWIALRDKAAELITKERAKHAAIEYLKQCPTCRGRGVIEVPQ